MNIDIYYDKECPFCNQYAKLIALKKDHSINIKNAREHLEILKEFKTKGFDINNGVIVVCNDNIYQGSDAIVFLDKLDKKSSIYDNWFFKKVCYPAIKFTRFILLKIFGRNPNIL